MLDQGVFHFLFSIETFKALILVAGLTLVIIEMFHPGIGAFGVTGGILLVVGVIWMANTPMQALILIILILAVLIIALTLVLQSASRGRLSKIMILSHSQQKDAGYIGTEDLQFLVGKEGYVTTILRPSGSADFDGVRLDVVSEGAFIQAGAKVKIVKVEGCRIVVREVN